ncbi:MAG: 50S ribosomal protein L11 methyltransferase [Actinomycetota bacterium]|nr:50S ribosomal protein L11 methyltransferase [Actinomycetota bacterium]
MIRLAVRCEPEYAEAVLANLVELAPNGVEEERGPGWVEFAIYGPPGEVPELGELKAAAGGSLVDVTTTAVPDDWADRWADFHRPIVVADRIGVRPSWWDAQDGLIDVMVDPGRAFGTGGHPTTRLSLALLLVLEEAGEADGALADWGTGSGVLAIAAAKLGWSPVTGCDRERASLEAAAANAEANGITLALERVDVREGPPPAAPTVVANLTASLLQECAAHLRGGADPGGDAAEIPGSIVCSGMLTTEIDGVTAAFAGCGLEVAERRTEGEWAGLLLRRTASGAQPW